jgi:hypothetical protein
MNDATNARISDLLRQAIADLENPDVHYTLDAAYNINERGERWYLAHLWLNQSTVWNPELTDTELVCELVMQEGSDRRSRIRVPFSVIYRIERMRATSSGKGIHEPTLFYDDARMKAMFAEMNQNLAEHRRAKQEASESE